MGQTYLVGNDGNISFPVLGTLKVGGLSKAECEKLIHDRIIRYLNGKEDPVVTVRMANYKISVLGEVARPGMFTVGNEEINIFEALTLAGDLTIYGVRDRVKLIRKHADGKRNVYTLNLNDANIIKSAPALLACKARSVRVVPAAKPPGTVAAGQKRVSVYWTSQAAKPSEAREGNARACKHTAFLAIKRGRPHCFLVSINKQKIK